jgi:hypothetical protein
MSTKARDEAPADARSRSVPISAPVDEAADRAARQARRSEPLDELARLSEELGGYPELD